MLSLYNTLSRQKETFKAIDDKNVRVYACGPTVYDYAHIGNARPVVAFDILFRVLRCLYGAEHVTYVRNITDIDDKIIARHKETGEPISEITARTAQMYQDDMGALNALPPTYQPRATQHISDMIALIERLIEKGHAYAAEGHVLFHVPSMPNYGALSRLNRDDLVAGARVEVAPYKKDAADFVLWKPSAEGDPSWESPWGKGRPGWHIECSAMSKAFLGDVFDIHAGGLDLIFPHHENEVAQSCCAHGTDRMAQYWLHNGFIMVEGKKMSKSLGNFTTVHDLLEKHHGEAIRLMLLSAHYRQPLDVSEKGLAEAKSTLDRWYGALRRHQDVDVDAEIPQTVLAALLDDLNTPLAVAEMHKIFTALNNAGTEAEIKICKAHFLGGASLLGILYEDATAFLKWQPTAQKDHGLSDVDIDHLLEERLQARADKNFARADEIRDILSDANIILEDGPGGTTWRRG